MRSIFFRILFIHLVVIAIFTSGLFLFFNLWNLIQDSPRAFTLLFAGALALTLILSLSASRTLTLPLEALLRRIRQFPQSGPSFLKKTQILEMDAVSTALDDLIFRLNTELAGMKLEKELLSSLLGALREGVLCLNRQGIVVYQNPALPGQLVQPAATGKPYFKAIANSELLEFAHHIMQAEHSNGANGNSNGDGNGRQVFEMHHGHNHYRVQEYPVRTGEEVELHLILVQDRTQEYNTRRLREDFLQNASHELKTPITSIRGYAETLIAKENRQPQTSFLKGVLRNVERMEAIIEDMVTIASLEARSFPFNPRVTDLDEFLNGIEILVEGTLKQKEQTLSIDSPRGRRIDADPLLLEHLLLNLIANASRYSPANSTIQVRIRRENNQATIFEVEDEGPGVPMDLREKIFERFFRVDKDRSREQGGTGLGLSIVRQITRLHGGSVWVEAAPRGGALFKVRLPG